MNPSPNPEIKKREGKYEKTEKTVLKSQTFEVVEVKNDNNKSLMGRTKVVILEIVYQTQKAKQSRKFS